MNLKIATEREYVLYASFIYNFRKCKLIYSDRKQIRGCLGVGRGQHGPEGTTVGREETFESGGHVHYLVDICKNLSNYILYKFMQFIVWQLYSHNL